MLTHWLALSRFYPCKARRPVHRLGVLLKHTLMTVAHCTGHLQSTSKYLTDLTISQGDKVRSITGGVVLLTKVFFLIITFSGVSKVRSMTSLFPCLQFKLIEDVFAEGSEAPCFNLQNPSDVNSTLFTSSGTDARISTINPSTINSDSGVGPLQICKCIKCLVLNLV